MAGTRDPTLFLEFDSGWGTFVSKGFFVWRNGVCSLLTPFPPDGLGRGGKAEDGQGEENDEMLHGVPTDIEWVNDTR